MHIFANKFSIALNQDKTEVMLSFFQNYPSLNEQLTADGSQIDMSTTVEPVSQLVMTGPCAKSLAEALGSLMNDTAPEK